MKPKTPKEVVAGVLDTRSATEYEAFLIWAQQHNLEAVSSHLAASSRYVRHSKEGELQICAEALYRQASAMWSRAGVEGVRRKRLEALLTGSLADDTLEREKVFPCWKLQQIRWADSRKWSFTIDKQWSIVSEAISAALTILCRPLGALVMLEKKKNANHLAVHKAIESDVDLSDEARRNSGSEACPSNAIGMPGE